MNSRTSIRFGVALALASAATLLAAQLTLGAHAVLVEGAGDVQYTYGVDFDTGAFNTPFPASGNEFYYEIVNSTTRLITLTTSPGILRMSSKPGYRTCQAAALTQKAYNAKKSEGRWFCIETGESRLARFQIVSAAKGQPMHIVFTTWTKPGD